MILFEEGDRRSFRNRLNTLGDRAAPWGTPLGGALSTPLGRLQVFVLYCGWRLLGRRRESSHTTVSFFRSVGLSILWICGEVRCHMLALCVLQFVWYGLGVWGGLSRRVCFEFAVEGGGGGMPVSRCLVFCCGVRSDWMLTWGPGWLWDWVVSCRS